MSIPQEWLPCGECDDGPITVSDCPTCRGRGLMASGRSAYIAGPMTGFEHYNVEAFDRAARRWTASGWLVRTPFDANSEVWQQHHGRPFDPYSDRCEYGDPLLRAMFAADIAVLLGAGVIVLLDGWRKSRGATVEMTVARLFSIPAFSEHGEPVPHEGELGTVLPEAQRLVHGDRGDSYGHPIEDYDATGRIWGAILDRWLRQQPGFEAMPRFPDIDPRIGALMMSGVKVSREAHRAKHDNRVDGAGYFECVEMIDAEQARRRRSIVELSARAG